MKNHKKLIIIIAVVLVLGIGSYFAYTKFFASKASNTDKFNDKVKEILVSSNDQALASLQALQDLGFITKDQYNIVIFKIDDVVDQGYADSILSGKSHEDSLALIK